MVEQAKPTTAATASGFSRFIAGISKVIDPLAKYGGYVASVSLAFMMFLTVLDVIGRKLGDWSFIQQHLDFIGPISGSLEMTELGLGVLVSLGLGYCALKKGHIRVDLIMQYTSRKANQWFDVFAYGISALFYCAVAWQAWNNGFSIIANDLKTAVLMIPIYPFPFVLVLGAAILALVFFRDFFNAIEEVRK